MRFPVISLLLTLGCFSLIFPQEQAPTPEQILEMSLEDLMNIKVTTAAKTEQRAWEASARVVVITREVIRQRGYRDLLDVLREVPFFQIQSEHGHWTKGAIVNLRGHRSGDSGNNKFLILMDGIKLSDDAEEGLYLGLRSFPLNGIEQIEIVYGPNSILYGRDAYAGMINLITRKGEYAAAGFGYGTYYSRTAYAGLKKNFSEEVSGVLHLSHYKSEEQDPTNRSVTYRNRHVFPAHPYTERFFRGSNNLFLHLGLHVHRFHFRYILSDVEGSETYGGNPDLYVTEYSTVAAQKNQALYADFTHSFSGNLNAQLYYVYKKYEFDPRTANLYTDDLYRSGYVNPVDSSIVIDPYYAYGGRKYYYFRTRAHKAGIKFTYQIHPGLKNVAGVDLNLVKGIPVISEGKGGKPITTRAQREKLEHDFHTIGFFSEFSYRTGQHFLFSIGGRIDINSNYQNTFMPRLAAIYRRGNHILKVILSRGYLAPSITQVYFESITTFSWIRRNEKLKPETNTSLELDWTYGLDHTRLSLNIFYNDLKDGISESVTTGDSTFVFVGEDSFYVPILQSQNLRDGYRWGFCLELKRQLGKNWQVNANYAFLGGEDKYRGITQPIADNLIAPHTFNLGLYFQWKRLSIYGGVNWLSKRRIKSFHTTTPYSILLDDEGFLNFDSVLLTNLNIRLNNLYDGLDLYLHIKNLFDSEYYGQTINAAWGSPKILQDLRRIEIGFDYEF